MKKIITLPLLLLAATFFSFVNAQCDPPTGLTATYNNNVSTFSWDPVIGADYRMQIRFLGYPSWGTTELTATTNSYTLTGLMQGMDFEWRVKVNCGSSMSSYTTSQYTTPCPQPSGLNTTAITTTSATLNWVPAPGYNTNISDFSVAYRLANTTNAWIQLGNTSVTSKNVTGLLPGTAYEWRVNQNCANYNGSFATAQFTTIALPCTAPAGLTAVYNNNVTTFNWNLVPNANEYFLQIKYPGYDWTQVEYETIVSGNSLQLTGIIQSGTFDWRVLAVCGTGNLSAYTESQVTLPCPQPSNLNTTNITTTSATLNWTPAPGLNTNISNFYVSYRLAGTSNNWTSAGSTFTGSKNITGLAPGTSYEWRVYQTCPYFNSTIVISQFTTLSANGCNTPTGLTATGIGNANAVISWTAVPGVTSYWLQYRAVNATAWIGVSNITGTSYALNNCLSTGTTYQYQVRSKCGNNYSAFSPISLFTTLNCISYGNNNSEWIDRFKLGTIDRVSGAESGGYKNTGLSTNLTIGSSNSGQISAGFPGSVRNQNYAVYIDFNRNGRYDDAGERVFGAGLIAGAGNCNFSANIPATATPGPTGMRVVMRKTSDGPVLPCLTAFLGETEDYTVTLVASSSRFSETPALIPVPEQNKITVSPNPSDGIYTVKLPQETEFNYYEIVNASGMIIQKGDTRKASILHIDITTMARGLYILKLKDPNGVQQIQKLIKN